MTGLREWVRDCFAPGRMYALVGSGGKSTGMRTVSRLLSAEGLRVRMSTTTRLGAEEFAGYPVEAAGGARELRRALESARPEILIAAGAAAGGKLPGVERGLLEAAPVPPDTVLLVECDGARRLPMKAPRPWEPVVPRTAAAVFALMGASAFGRPICAATCYNPEGALQILGIASGVFDAHALAVLASDPRGYRKGVPPGAAFCLVVNQGDITAGREIASALLRELSALHGITGALLSWQEQAVYETTGAGKAARC